MKRVLILLVLGSLCLALGGCSLRNRQSSEQFIPSGTRTPWETYAPVQRPSSPATEQGLGTGAVKTVLSREGEIPLSQPVTQYYYRLPMIDLPGAYAAGCNQEIEARFGSLIQESLDSMDRYETPVLETLTFDSYTFSGILTLRIDCRRTDGSISQAYYTVGVANGEQVTVQAMLDAAGVDQDLEELLTQKVTDRFEALYFADYSGTPAYNTALTQTLAAISQVDVHRMHLTQTGGLAAAVTICGPQGTVVLEELLLQE